MLDGCLDLLERATKCGVTETFFVVFPARHPLTGEGGARVWNTQLLRYAGYRNDDMSVTGDPAELQFTELAIRKFGWRPQGNMLGSALKVYRFTYHEASTA